MTPPGAVASGSRRAGRVAAAPARARVAALLALGLAAAGPAGCAKKPTGVIADVSVDPAVPPLLQLRISVASASDPSLVASNSYTSLFKGDAADRPGAFFFPLKLSMNLPVDFAGDVIVTVEGLDWDTNAVVARGAGTAQVVVEKTAMTALTLTPVVGTNPDAGEGSDGGTDGEPGDGDGGVDADAAAPDAAVDAGPDAIVEAGSDAAPADDGPLDLAPDGGVPDIADDAGGDAADDAAPDGDDAATID